MAHHIQLEISEKKRTSLNHLTHPLAWIVLSLILTKFLYTKISKKLDYLSTMKLSIACRVAICNYVLLSTLWFLIFITVLGASNKILQKIKGKIRNYHWSGKKQLTHTKINWKDFCIKKKHIGLRMVDPKAPKTTCYVNGSSSYGARWVQPSTHFKM